MIPSSGNWAVPMTRNLQNALIFRLIEDEPPGPIREAEPVVNIIYDPSVTIE